MTENKERRIGDATIAELVSMMRSLLNDFGGHGDKLICIEKKLDLVLSAFPSGEKGLVEHKSFHETQISRAKDEHEFRQNLKRGLAMWGIGPVLLFAFYALWEYFKVKVHQP